MRPLLTVLRYLVNPLFWLVYLWFLGVLLLWLYAGWLGLRLGWQYAKYTCGRSLARQIRPDLGRLHDKTAHARDTALRAGRAAAAFWKRLHTIY